MAATDPVISAILNRYSCRVYRKEALPEKLLADLAELVGNWTAGPLGTPVRFELVDATDRDRNALRGLGTYGFIQDAPAFIVGAMLSGKQDLEDFGFCMEEIILHTTNLGLGTCWLGGTFAKSNFARAISVRGDEQMPAVTALGYPAEGESVRDRIRLGMRADQRLPWSALFFDGAFETPLSREAVHGYETPLEMVRLGPSASNKQPWRILRQDATWHFFLQRTKGYGRGSLTFRALRLADLQRVDMGIAMCHFDLAAKACGIQGAWRIQNPGLVDLGSGLEYCASWMETRAD